MQSALQGGGDRRVQELGRDRQMTVRLKIVATLRPDVMQREDHAAPRRGWHQPAGTRPGDRLEAGTDHQGFGRAFRH